MAKTTTKQTMAKIVLDVFKKHKATSPDTAIPVTAFKDVKCQHTIWLNDLFLLLGHNLCLCS